MKLAELGVIKMEVDDPVVVLAAEVARAIEDSAAGSTALRTSFPSLGLFDTSVAPPTNSRVDAEMLVRLALSEMMRLFPTLISLSISKVTN